MSISQYHFILPLQGNINYLTTKFKKEIYPIIGEYGSRNAKPHITINNYPRHLKYFDESGLMSFGRRLNNLSPIELHANEFGFFENDKNMTLCIKINFDLKTECWFEKLWNIVGKYGDTPHITIARAFSHEQFKLIWPLFKYRIINEKFVVSALTILKNLPFEHYSKSKVFSEINFNGIENLNYDSLNNIHKTYTPNYQQLKLF